MNVCFQLSTHLSYRDTSTAWNRILETLTRRESQTVTELLVTDTPPAEIPLHYGEWAVSFQSGRLLVTAMEEAGLVRGMRKAAEILKSGKECPLFHSKRKYFQIPRSLLGVSLERVCLYYNELEEMKKERRDEVREDYHRIGAAKQAALDLRDFIGRLTGVSLKVLPLQEGIPSEGSILIGPREETSLPYGTVRICEEAGRVLVEGSDICALESGVSYLAELLKNGSDLSSVAYEEALPPRDEYEKNPDAFLPCYRKRLSLSSDEISMERKAAKLEDPSLPAFLIAHRGEHTYYPENSLEGILSAWRCGADSAELDLSRTRDGVWILMHDKTLTRTTDVAEKKGKNGLPDSMVIADWSLEELRELRLYDSYGRISPFLIPTLEEVLCAAEGRIYLHLDKKFDYREELFPLMRKWGLFRSLYLCNYVDREQILELRDDFRDCGIRFPSIYRLNSQNPLKLNRELEELASPDCTLAPNVILLNDYHKYFRSQKALVPVYRDKLRIGCWMMWGTDSEFFWQEALDLGFGIFMTNFPLLFRRYLEEE